MKNILSLSLTFLFVLFNIPLYSTTIIHKNMVSSFKQIFTNTEQLLIYFNFLYEITDFYTEIKELTQNRLVAIFHFSSPKDEDDVEEILNMMRYKLSHYNWEIII